MKLFKYGKKFECIREIMGNFAVENDKYNRENKRIVDIYLSQPMRMHCKVCNGSLQDAEDFFEIHGMKYMFCPKCGHINGEKEETAEFNKKVYVEDDYGDVYKTSFIDEYNRRIQEIYIPKVEFLKSVLMA